MWRTALVAATLPHAAAMLIWPDAGCRHAPHVCHARVATRSIVLAAAASSPLDDEDAGERDADAGEAELNLSQLIGQRPTNQVVVDEEKLRSVGQAWALLFKPGSGNEGIYSRQEGDTNIVLVFQEEEDAERYASMLSATDFPEAEATSIEIEGLLAFCNDGGHMLGMVPTGALVTPPEESVDDFDWQPDPMPPSAEALEGASEMTQEELDAARRSLGSLFDSSEDV
jgi:hypothetical protein